MRYPVAFLKYLGIVPASLAVVLLCVSAAHAQIDLSGAIAGEGSDVSIVMTPQSPGPNETIDLSVESSLLDTTDSAITWYKNGTVIAQGTGVTSASIVTGALGKETDISVAIQTPDGTRASTQLAIIPTETDLLVDSDSYVPPFYQGRALPSAGTNLRLEAITHFKRPDGSVVPSSDITYTWKQDGRVVGNVSGRGKSSVELPSPTLYGTSNIEVDAESSDDTLAGSASLSIPSTTPFVLLYEDNPLLGLTYYHALAAQTTIPDTEMTFAAVPFFAQIQSPNDPRLAYTWTVNGSAISPSANDPSEITLNASDSNGEADIGLGLTHSTNIFMSTSGEWDVTLGTTNSSSFGNSVTGVKDPFSGKTQ